MKKLVLGLVGAVLVFGSVAMAQQRPFPPRQFDSQQVHYIRWVFNYNSCKLASGTCNVQVGAVPYNSFVLRGWQQIIASFNSGTSDTLAIGVTGTGDQIVAAQSVHGAPAAATALTLVSGLGLLGNSAAASGTLGGFDIFTHYVQVGTAPTAGTAVLVLEYAAPNDGACAPVPLGATAVGC